MQHPITDRDQSAYAESIKRLAIEMREMLGMGPAADIPHVGCTWKGWIQGDTRTQATREETKTEDGGKERQRKADVQWQHRGKIDRIRSHNVAHANPRESFTMEGCRVATLRGAFQEKSDENEHDGIPFVLRE